MIDRELAIEEIEKRVAPLINSLGLKQILVAPSRAIVKDDMPCILLMEGEDDITRRTGRDYVSYPCRRKLLLTIECWDKESGDVRNINKEARQKVLDNKRGIVIEGTTILIREERAVGPYNMGIPEVLGMRTIYGLSYDDLGPTLD